MSFFDGLYSYQIVLMVLGIILFFVFVGAFVALMIKGKPYVKLLPFFLLPIVMIGYPGIESVSYQNGVVTITNATESLQQNPTDNTLRQTLQTAVDKTASRPTTNPDTITAIAAAQFALGDHQAAEAKLKTALEKSPQLPAAIALEKRIELNKNLNALTTQVEQNPGNEAARANLQQTVAQGSALKISSPVMITNLARAQAAVGNQQQAVKLADQALKIQPNLAEAAAVKQQLGQGK